MKKAVSLALLLFTVVVLPAGAQSFGELFPVTNTRYRPAFARPQLATNGKDFFMFWQSEQKVRATRLREAETRAGHVILTADAVSSYDVAWTGERFLAVYSRFVLGGHRMDLMGQLLDENARPVGAEFAIAEDGRNPRIASNGNGVMLVYQDASGKLFGKLLHADGRSTAVPARILAFGSYSHAAAASDDGFGVVTDGPQGTRAITLDAQGQTLAEREIAGRTFSSRAVAIASDGNRYLVVWCGEEGTAATTLDPNGTLGSTLLVDGGTIRETPVRTADPTAIWNGAGWSVSYESFAFGSVQRTTVAQLDFGALRVVSREDSENGTVAPSVAALDGRIMTAWLPVAGAGAKVAELPLATNPAREASYAATRQTLLATASSAHGTLIVWNETSANRSSIRTGVRGHDGGWSEREIVSTAGSAIAASDGTNFAVAVTTVNGTELIRLDEGAQELPGRLTLPEGAAAMAWNGTHYAVISVWSAKGLLVTPAGQLAATVDIPNLSFAPKSLVSDGHGFFLGGEEVNCQFLLCFPQSVRGVRLDANLQRIDPQDLVFSDANATMAGAGWNGSEYVFVWTDPNATRIARIPSSTTQPTSIETPNFRFHDTPSMAVLSDGSLAIQSWVGHHASESRIAFVRKDGSTAGVVTIPGSAGPTGAPRLAPLPNGGVAYVVSNIQDAAPHHGTSHVMMAIARPTPLAEPTPPYVSVSLDATQLRAEWSGASGAINGYRLEYRVDDVSWNELDAWFGPGAHSATITRPSFGTTFAIRVRAFNDAGTSAYSPAALTHPGRRRAVR